MFILTTPTTHASSFALIVWCGGALPVVGREWMCRPETRRLSSMPSWTRRSPATETRDRPFANSWVISTVR